MARLGETFDATTVEPNKPLEALPPGRYVVQIVNSEMRPTKDGMGQLLWLELDVLEGEYAGRKLFDRLNLINNNPTTVEIAQRTLSAICHAVGKMQVDDSEQLHLIPLIADVKVQPPKNGYDASNTLRYMPLEQQPAPRPVAPAARPAVAARPASAGGFSGARGKEPAPRPGGAAADRWRPCGIMPRTCRRRGRRAGRGWPNSLPRWRRSRRGSPPPISNGNGAAAGSIRSSFRKADGAARQAARDRAASPGTWRRCRRGAMHSRIG